jgi:hypothetical protein
MKSSPSIRSSRSNCTRGLDLACFSALVAAGLLTLAPTLARASAELDRRYQLDTVGSLRSHDNVDGLFADYVSESIREYFSNQPRFLLQDLSRSDAVLATSKAPYQKLIEDQQILLKVARTTRSSTLLRTRIFKEGSRYRFTLDWLHAPKMEALATEVFYMDEPGRGEALGAEQIKSQLHDAIDRMIRKVPFQGTLTGRDQASVTLNVGESSGIRKGDTLVIGTIEEVKRHPLLKSIVEWRLVPTGKVEVDQVDRGMTFGHVIEEDAAKPISKNHKLMEVIAHPDPVLAAQASSTGDLPPLTDRLDPPKYGWISAGLVAGSFARQTANSAGTAGKDGGGLGGGANAEAQVWLNRQWFVEGLLGYSLYGYSQTDLASGAASGDGFISTLFQQRLGVGYSYIPGSNFFAAKSWVKIGTQASSYSLARSAAEQTNPIKFTGYYLGIGGDLPLRGGWGAQMNLNFGLTNTATETDGALGDAESATNVEFYAGAVKQVRPRLLFRVGLNFTAQGATYDTGATLSHHALMIMPSWVMLF